MVSRQRLDAKKDQYQDLAVLADSLATRIEECWLGSWQDAPWEGWGAESRQAVQAADTACRLLLRIYDLLDAMPADPE